MVDRAFSTTARQTLAAILFAALPAGFGLPAVADAGDSSGYDRIWEAAKLYEGEADSFFQSFAFTGRLQLDLAQVDSGDDDHGELNVRRFRFGFKTVFLEDFTLHVEGDFDPQGADPFYRRLTDAYLAWSPSQRFKLKAGKQSAGFTLDGMTSSKQLLTVDRSNLSNNIWFTEEYMPGLSFQGEAGAFSYFAGVFSSGPRDPEFGDLEGGTFVLLTLGYDFADRLGAEEAVVRFNLVDNEPEPADGFTNLLDRIYSLSFSYEGERWGLRTDVSAGDGTFGQSDVRGFYVMPYRKLSDKLELVARYTLVDSDEANGVRFARYERSIAGGRGDRYDEIYLGLNCYWYGHKLKLHNGAQYVDMRDEADDGGTYTGWAWTTALRVSW